LPLPSSGARHGPDGHDAAAGRPAFVARGYQILGCPHCRLRWTHIPASSAFDPKALYTQAYFEGGVPDGYYDYVGSEAFLVREYAKRLEVIRSYQASGRLLEVGCATGAFLAHAGRYFSTEGIDVSAFAVQEARGKGLKVTCGTLDDADLAPPYDVAVLFDTIEHLEAPARTLTRLHALLAPRGYVVITTGDAGSVLARLSGRAWRLMTPPQHLWFFSKRNLRLLLERLGFEVRSARYRWRLVPVSLMWYQLVRGRLGLPHPVLNQMVLPVNLYDTVTVVAQRRPDPGHGVER